MSDYTPSTAQIRDFWVSHGKRMPVAKAYTELECAAEFDRWLDEVTREAAAEALTQFADSIRAPQSLFYDGDGPITVNDLLRRRAAAYRVADQNGGE